MKAHRNQAEAENEWEAVLIKGNDVADGAAKKGRETHPTMTKEESKALAEETRIAREVVCVLGATLAQWPAIAKAQLLSSLPGAQPKQREDRHRWSFRSGAWRCKRCGAHAREETGPDGEQRRKCKGSHAAIEDAEMREGGHEPKRFHSDGVPVVSCDRCGLRASWKAVTPWL